jgi:hypothetical protein
MEFWIVAGSCFTFGFIAGWMVMTRPHPDRIDRFYMQDQQHYERWQAYCQLEDRIKERKP